MNSCIRVVKDHRTPVRLVQIVFAVCLSGTAVLQIYLSNYVLESRCIQIQVSSYGFTGL